VTNLTNKGKYEVHVRAIGESDHHLRRVQHGTVLDERRDEHIVIERERERESTRMRGMQFQRGACFILGLGTFRC